MTAEHPRRRFKVDLAGSLAADAAASAKRIGSPAWQTALSREFRWQTAIGSVSAQSAVSKAMATLGIGVTRLAEHPLDKILRSGTEPKWARMVSGIGESTLRLTRHLLPEMPAAQVAKGLLGLGSDPFHRVLRDSMLASGVNARLSSQMLSGMFASRLVGGVRLQRLRSDFALVDALAEFDAPSSEAEGDGPRLRVAVERLGESLRVTNLSSLAKRLTLDQLLALLGLLLAAVVFAREVIREEGQDQQAAEAERESAARHDELKAVLERSVAEQRQVLERRIAEAARVVEPTVYCVVRSTSVRNGKRTKSKTVGHVFEGDVLDVMERHGKSTRIRYFDALDGVERVGWVKKKCLRRLTLRRGMRR